MEALAQLRCMHKILLLPSKKVIYAERGSLLIDALRGTGGCVSADCGGIGRCKKCSVRLIMGEIDGVVCRRADEVLSCREYVTEDLIIELDMSLGDGLEEFDHTSALGGSEGYGIILDIGTTTLAACLVDLSDKRIVKKCSRLNPQRAYGADVLSRIAASHDRLDDLRRVIIDATENIVAELSGGKRVKELAVAANTTMLHLFLGVDPSSIGVAPFTPIFVNERILSGDELGLSVDRVILLPSASAYIGADAVAGALSLNMHKSDKTSLLVDIGTNGEIILSKRGELFATSAAAGPALEGACIECGMGGVLGAVSRASMSGGELVISTVGDVEPVGICGSGLIDVIAVLLDEGIVDESGAIYDSGSSLFSRVSGDRFYVTEKVYVSQKDIRQFQLAKSAISSAIECLLEECGVAEEDIDQLYLAGGLGYYINIESAGRVGLLPRKIIGVTKSIGNGSLAGAFKCLDSMDGLSQAAKVAEGIKVVELATSPSFYDAFVEHMTFE